MQRIQADLEYHRFWSTARALMNRRSRSGLLRLRLRNSELPPSGAWAVRGSYARRTPNFASDIDLIRIDRYTDSALRTFFRMARPSAPRVSCLRYGLYPKPTNAEFRICWQALDSMRFLSGRRDTYAEFVAQAHDALISTSLDELLRLFATELAAFAITRCQSVDFRDMKRGPGGQIELEFITVLHRWQHSSNRRASKTQASISIALQRYRSYLALLKEYARMTAGTDTDSREVLARCAPLRVPWFFSNDVSDELALEHHDMATIFIGLLSESAAAGNA